MDNIYFKTKDEIKLRNELDRLLRVQITCPGPQVYDIDLPKKGELVTYEKCINSCSCPWLEHLRDKVLNIQEELLKLKN